ncbi:ALG3 protein-domain-containing protein [Naematelia encephala]|uniref:Dol-P-Man:Man(5)GlcNAc(2)-PP-Dol alpha-1,3-mannosyltransferase n=1 Tax=Naematelia encephala TaxID=71784 RepID=A0A1Y2BDJ0_9TREE|nr:ALG3 protein-domain-containing protein [Naematelia encephala]
MPPIRPPDSSSPSSRGPNAARQLVSLVKALCFDRRYYWHVVSLLFLGELFLGLLIIHKVPYTKIDWPAYMQQVEAFLDGERDYSRIEGETGPLVYPALHLYIYTALHSLPYANRVRAAQYIFLGMYLLTFLLVATIYFHSKRIPQILLVPLTLSKRAHSIYLLRLFNDPLAMVLLYAAVLSLMYGRWRLGSVVYSLALGVKMNILLFLPGLLVLSFQHRGLIKTLQNLTIITIIQLLLPSPYFVSFANSYLTKSYFSSAFDLSRQFLYEWTVNWRFVPSSTFLSREFALGLLGSHVGLLIIFAWFKWSPIPGGTITVLRRGLLQSWTNPPVPQHTLPSHHISLVLFTSNLIGMTCARSLHYQFHAWYFHQIPLLLWFGGAWGSASLGAALWLSTQYAWATAPSTLLSSGLLLGTHLIILLGLLFHNQATRPKIIPNPSPIPSPTPAPTPAAPIPIPETKKNT